MKNENSYKSLAPLDFITILYILLSGIYVCFAPHGLLWILPHLTVRLGMLVAMSCLLFLNTRFPESKPIHFLKGLYPLLFLSFFYAETSCMKNIIFSTNFDGYFVNAEERLWHCQPSIEFSRIMSQGWFNEIMNLCYFSYYIMIGAVCIVLYLKQPAQSQKNIFIVIFSFYLYYIIFALFPVVGPQYYIQEINANVAPPYFFGKLMHYLTTNMEQPTGAFPSSHVGIAAIISYLTFQHHRKLFFITLPFVVGICFATVYLKEHYLVDVIGGLLSAPLFVSLSNKAYHWLLNLMGYHKDEAVTVS